ncbi:xanthine dehydrogenase molybdopterin binding subunit [Pseudooceanicola sp. CBS1P-1]|uniref:Xanthine dehydrogenase molybdopterin binding subunit n=1 Tax=Pseudooceanicola albus TaxID=2692189 RepID=A0A6L7GAF3_9RHOB|nr:MULTISPECIES: xanthine dehydrogenase molybdopterin binding subunit [Pseudooceanicola]MBT9386919.1 xanthine dehydrogenase molybdopterin binding subunit [Pseudooceanicola endophyticus]MXN21025.1 xanthine dehydrogenase molybdopterin binding subunit [Pseudooceanicola albus]
MNEIVHKSLPHDAAPLHVSGEARYIDDIPLPANTLHLAFGTSPVAKGVLKGLDLAKVRAAPGVVAVLLAQDLPFANDVSSAPVHDEPLLSTGTLNYLGQPVFLVAATSHLAARFAARQAVWDIEEGTPILTVDEALEANSYIEHPPLVWTKGDAGAAITAAPRRLEGRIEMGGQEHFYLESQAALAIPQEGGDMYVSSSTQHPTEIQHKVAEALGVPMHAVRVESRRMGGGFGGKESQGNPLAVACAVVARATGRPAKMRYDRDDDMQITGKRHDFRIDYTVGFDGTGRILGVDFRQYTRCGWSQDLSLAVADRAMLHADNAYLMEHIRIESHRLRTNMCSATAYRGFGGPQGIVGIERVVDHIAHELGMDPIEVRRVNYYADAPVGAVHGGSAPAPAAPPRGTSDKKMDLTSRGAAAAFPVEGEVVAGRGQTTPYGMDVFDFALHRMTERLLESADYAARKAAVAEWNAHNPVLKKGLGFAPVKFGISFTLSHLNQAGALVHVYQDGSVHLNHGGTEMGQGLFQKVAQVAASRFGIPLDMVKITATDTAKVPNTSATAASSGSDLNGMAVKAACDTIRDRIAGVVAALHQCATEEVSFEGGEVRAGGEAMPFAKAAMLAYEAQVSLSATGHYRTPDLSWDRIRGQGRAFYYFAHGAALSEVVIDTLTGEYRFLRTDILHDAGASLNPALDIGQVEGGYVQGAGWLTSEELVWDGKGRLRTHAPSTYKIPAVSDRPKVFNVDLWDEPNPSATIYRSKAVGEPPFVLGIAPFLALSDAIGACGAGYPALDAPATPERVLAAVRRMRDA